MPQSAKDFLIEKGFDAQYGARPLRRAIQTYVDDALADALLADEIASGQAVKLVVRDDKIVVRPLEHLQGQSV